MGRNEAAPSRTASVGDRALACYPRVHQKVQRIMIDSR